MSGPLVRQLDPRSFTGAVALGAALGMVASALEFLVHGVTLLATDRFLYQGSDVVWAKPLVNLVLFVPASVVLRALPLRAFLFCLCFAVSAAPLLLVSPGKPLPLLILAAGIATQASSFLAPAQRQRAVLRGGKVLAGLFVASAAVVEATKAYRERFSAPTMSAPANAPNVLLIILDTVRGASLSMLGGRASTPHLDSLAANGILFERAISAAPWTLPSHATLFTGLWPYEHGADWRTPLDERAPTLAEAFLRQGYRTGGFVANLIYTSREHGLDRGFQTYRDYQRTPGALLRSAALGQTLVTSTLVRRLTGFYDVAGRKAGPVVNREFLDWHKRTGARPWFAFLNYFDAHGPLLPRPPFAGRYSAGLPARRFEKWRFWGIEGGIASWNALQPPEMEAERAAYEEAITGLDADVGDLLGELRRRGVLDRTLVVITADHGALFGEHDTFSHGNSLYWRTVHVPLIISWLGGVPAGQRVSTPVSLRNLPATILQLALPASTVTLPGTRLPEGVSMAAAPLVFSQLSVEEFARDVPAMRNGSLQSVVGADWQYIRAANGHEDVFRIGSGWSDSLITDAPLRTAIVDTARARLATARIPPPPPPR